ncbi:hypothetical protein BDW02DRAFT_628177 [Neofusicoccum parvum]|uniref:Uncharacterized protein n=1 Tax=Neofusicoccum parvum TaxID=310453 RepID=A0ACB5SPL4_9PEZI|nr:hypothetical protein BDW02DRAFT_628177 [Neofusicoccum parvum]
MSTSTPNTRAWSSGHLAQSGHRGGTGEFDPDHLDPSASISSVLPGSPNDPIDERGINEDVDDLEEGDDRDLADGAPAPRRAWPWTFKQLLKRVETAKGEASRPVVNFVKEYLGGTKLILVAGQSGRGKTSLLQELTGLSLQVGGTLKAGTHRYQICPAIIDSEQYLFVDTPGFGTGVKDAENHDHILSCLRTLGPFVDFTGILLVHGAPGTRVTEEDHKTIRWVQCFCGPKLFKSITIVTTMWDLWNDVGLKKQWMKAGLLESDEDITLILNPPDYHHGGEIYHHGFPGGRGGPDAFPNVLGQEANAVQRSEEIQNLIRRRYGARLEGQPQIMAELAKGVPVMETEAAKVLRVGPLDYKIEIMQDRAAVEISSSGGSVPERAFQPLPLPGPESSWFDSIVVWLEAAWKAAMYFKKHRDARNSSKPMLSVLWDEMWTNLTSWWCGTSEN